MDGIQARRLGESLEVEVLYLARITTVASHGLVAVGAAGVQ